MNSLSGKFEVEVGKKKYTCHLSMNAFRLLCERENITFAQMDGYLSDKPLTAVPKVIWYGMVNNIYMTKGDLDKLPDYEHFASVLLDDVTSVEKYSTLIGKAFAGEDDSDKEGNE